MKHKLSKIPPLEGSADRRCEALRAHSNRLVEELIKAFEAQDKELQQLRKEIHSRERQ